MRPILPNAFPLIAMGAMFLISACFPIGEYEYVEEDAEIATALPSDAPIADGAEEHCSDIDETNPEHDFCLDCYTEVLESYCPGITDPSECKDTNVAQNFTNYVNTCVSNSVVAGFTCIKSCSSGFVLDASSCSCVADVSSVSGLSGSVDIGQTDFGPPVVSAQWPLSGVVGTSTGTNALPSSCEASFDSAAALWFRIQNRSGTLGRLNTFGTPTASPTPEVESFSAPELAVASTTEAPSGASAFAEITFEVNAKSAVESATYGIAGWIKHVAGTGTEDDDAGVEAISADLHWPTFTTVDRYGNIYFSDSNNNKVKVICYFTTQNATYPYNHFCDGKQYGYVYTVAGGGATAFNYNTEVATNAVLSSPRGVALDQFNNLYIADMGNDVISLVCAEDHNADLHGTCNGGGRAVNRIYVIVGTGVNGATNTADWTTSTLTTVYGIDVISNGLDGVNAANIYFADGGTHGIRVACGYDDNASCDGIASNTVTTVFGTLGTSGTSVSLLNGPTDVKVSWDGNIFVADNTNYRVMARCYKTNGTDYCKSKSSGEQIIAGTGTQGNSSDGVSGTSAKVGQPYQLAIGKRYNDDQSSSSFRDNNIVWAEEIDATNSFGNVVKVLCGDNSAMQSAGYCKDKTAGTVHRLAGQSGQVAVSGVLGTNGNDGPALEAAFASLKGVTYDKYKNIIVASADVTNSAGVAYLEHSLRLISYASYVNAASSTSMQVYGVKYSFTDSNQQTSYYCLQFNVQVQCFYEQCDCAAVPLNNLTSAFWAGSSASMSCPQ